MDVNCFIVKVEHDGGEFEIGQGVRVVRVVPILNRFYFRDSNVALIRILNTQYGNLFEPLADKRNRCSHIFLETGQYTARAA